MLALFCAAWLQAAIVPCVMAHGEAASQPDEGLQDLGHDPHGGHDHAAMLAGQGITHSERTDGAARKAPLSMFGLQTWLALPKDQEEVTAGFTASRYRPCCAASDARLYRTSASSSCRLIVVLSA